MITKLVSCACEVVATGVVLGGAGAIFVGVLAETVLTRVTFPPASLTVGLLVRIEPEVVVVVHPARDNLFTTTG